MAETLYGDYDFSGVINDKGKIKSLTNDDALNLSIKLWLISKEGDMVNFPSRGGYVYPYLLSPMKEDTIDKIKQAIQDGLYEDFYPEVIVEEIEVIPNYTRKYWEIKIALYFPDIEYTINFAEKVKNQG